MRTSSKNSSEVSCAFIPIFSRLRPRLKPGPVALDNEQRHALGAGTDVGLGREHDKIAELTVRDKDLLAVDDEIIAVANRAGPDRLEVAAGMRFGHSERTDGFARHHLRQPLALLLLGSKRQEDRSRPDRCGSESPGRWRRTATIPRTRRRRTDSRDPFAAILPPARYSTSRPSAPALSHSSRGTMPSSSHLA